MLCGTIIWLQCSWGTTALWFRGQYCSSQYLPHLPPIQTRTDRRLWLGFHSIEQCSARLAPVSEVRGFSMSLWMCCAIPTGALPNWELQQQQIFLSHSWTRRSPFFSANSSSSHQICLVQFPPLLKRFDSQCSEACISCQLFVCFVEGEDNFHFSSWDQAEKYSGFIRSEKENKKKFSCLVT